MDMENDVGRIDTEHTNLYYEFKDYCNHNEIKMKDLTVQFVVEKMKSQLDSGSIYTNIEDLYDTVNRMKGKGFVSAIASGGAQPQP